MHAVHVPHEHANDDSVLLLEWLVADGERVEQGRAIVTLETSKATFDLEAPMAGYVRFNRAEETEVGVGEVLCFIADNADVPIPEASGRGEPARDAGDLRLTAQSPARFSHKALALMKEHGLTEEQFAGTGLIKASDVLKMAGSNRISALSSESDSLQMPLMGTVPSRIEELPRRKRIEVKYLTSGQNALGSLVNVICSTRGLKAAAQQHLNMGVGPLPLVIHETARLLRKYPVLNACYQDGKVLYYEQINVGFALDAGSGLKVPIVVNADQKSINNITMEVEDLIGCYLEDSLSPESIEGGTFTISDLSGEDVHSFVPLINKGQAAILGIGAEYVPSDSVQGVFNLILAFDHRLTEGRAAACFLRDLRERIESYERVFGYGGNAAFDGEELSCARCLRTVSELETLKVPLLQEIAGSGKTSLICANCVLGY